MKMNQLKEFLKISLLTGYIKNEKPINVLIIGKPDTGKSALLSRIITNDGIIEMTDLSAWGITKMIVPLIEQDKKIKHIIIPDFLVIMAKSKSTADRTFTFVNSLIEEGISNIGTYMNRGIDFKQSQKVKDAKVQCGLITAITEQMYYKKKKRMNEFGFLSRFVPIRYSYSSDYMNEIFQNIMHGKYLHKEEDKILLPQEEIDIKYDNEEIHKMLVLIARNKISSGAVEAQGTRLLIMFKTILKAIALKNGRTEVLKEDFEEFLTYEPLINYSGRNITTIEQ